MFFLRSWLEDYINLQNLSNQDLSDLITLKSAEVDDLTETDDYFEGKVLIGKIINFRKHPDADKLNIFNVDLGSHNQQIQIVSAAPNAKESLIVPVATIGSKLAMGVILERKMRGEISQGMCLGKSELMLETEYSTGLWELNELFSNKNPDEYLGQSICKVLPEYFPKETILDIKYLADNFSSCGSHLGLALEIAMCLENPNLLTQKAKNYFDIDFLNTKIGQISSADDINIDFEDTSNYTNSFSVFDLKLSRPFILPHLLQKRLLLVGKNLIGGLADLSNYLIHDVGQPNHFFSKQKLLNLNNQNTTLQWKIEKTQTETRFAGLGKLKDTTIPKGVDILFNLEQSKTPISIVGISGGEETKIDFNETEGLIEIANFPSENVAKNSFSLKYRSDSARFYASGVNFQLQYILIVKILDVLEQTKQVIKDFEFDFSLVLNYINSNVLKNYNTNQGADFLLKTETILESSGSLAVDFDYIISRLDRQGKDFWQPVITRKLSAVGKLEGNNFNYNTFYKNCQTQEDLLELIIRLIGFDNLKAEYLNSTNRQDVEKTSKSLNFIRQIFSNFGFNETITRPFISENELESVVLGQYENQALKLINPYNSNKPYIRDSLLSSSLSCLSDNIVRGEKDPRIFEISKNYTKNQSSEIIYGTYLGASMVSENPYLLTSIVYKIGSKTNAGNIQYDKAAEKYNKLGNGYFYTLDNGLLIWFIEISNNIKKQFSLPLTKKIWHLGIYLDNWNQDFNSYKKYSDEADYPSIERSYSWVVKKDLQWKEVELALNSIYISKVNLTITPMERFEINKDEDVLNFDVSFVSYSRTLEGAEIETWENQALEKLKNRVTKR